MDLPGRFRAEENFTVDGHNHGLTSFYDGDFFQWFKFCESGQKAFDGKNYNQFYGKLKTDSDNTWRGGAYSDLIAPITDFSKFSEFTKKLSANKIWQKVATKFDQQMVRRRVRSEHDGEFDLDKKWDAQPFQNRAKKATSARIVKMNISGDFSSGVGPDVINDYGSFVVAIITMLERNGVQAEVTACYDGENFLSNGAKSFFRMRLKVKRADEYLPLNQLLKVFSTVWYRRAVFSLIVASAENLGKNVCDSLGNPWRRGGKCWDIINNEIFIYSVPSFEDQHHILEKLIEVVGEVKT